MTWRDEATTMVDDAAATFGQSVTLRQVARGAFNASTGRRAEKTTDYTVSANRLPIDQVDVSAGEGRLPAVEARFEVAVSALAVRPGRGWRLSADGVLWEIVNVDIDVDRLNYILDCAAARPDVN